MALRCCIALLVLLGGLLLVAQDPQQPESHDTVVVSGDGERAGVLQADLPAVEEQIVKLTNAFRRRQKREPLTVDEKLTAAAREFANYMAESGRYGHHADGRTPAGRVTEAGYDLCIVRENIAYLFRSTGFATKTLAEEFFTGWKNSPGHRENMLAPYVSEIGVAVAKSKDTDVYFAVQLFARPKSEAVTFQVVNGSDLTIPYRVGDRKFSLPPHVTQSHLECQPRSIKFFPAKRAPEPTGAVEPVESIDLTGGEKLAIEPTASGYRVTVSRDEETN